MTNQPLSLTTIEYYLRRASMLMARNGRDCPIALAYWQLGSWLNAARDSRCGILHNGFNHPAIGGAA